MASGKRAPKRLAILHREEWRVAVQIVADFQPVQMGKEFIRSPWTELFFIGD